MSPAPADRNRVRTRLDTLFAASKTPGLQYVAVTADGPAPGTFSKRAAEEGSTA